jgi:hypothetical protein
MEAYLFEHYRDTESGVENVGSQTPKLNQVFARKLDADVESDVMNSEETPTAPDSIIKEVESLFKNDGDKTKNPTPTPTTTGGDAATTTSAPTPTAISSAPTHNHAPTSVPTSFPTSYPTIKAILSENDEIVLGAAGLIAIIAVALLIVPIAAAFFWSSPKVSFSIPNPAEQTTLLGRKKSNFTLPSGEGDAAPPAEVASTGTV